MMHTDPISDFLTRIRNGQAARLDEIKLPSSQVKFSLAKILENEGFVGNVSEWTEDGKKYLSLALKYNGREPVIRSIKRISKPGLRIYRKSSNLPRVLSDIGIAIISTSVGIMTNKEARKRKLGGEVICEVY
ncbi:MAG: 30S ribosomal protein S8 [Patescibacteria group bacterium]